MKRFQGKGVPGGIVIGRIRVCREEKLQTICREVTNIEAEVERFRQAKAEAEKRIAQSKAEERKSMAIAAENEMKARVQEMRAEVVRAEAEVPKALAKALSSGKLSVNDYYEMQNIQADTAMRNSLSKTEEEKTEKLSTSNSAPKKDNSLVNSRPPMGGSPFGQTPYTPPMNPLAARFASLAASQKRNNTDDNNNK